MKVRSRSGEIRAKLKIDIFAKNGSRFDAVRHGESNGGLCFALRGLELSKIEFENLTSSFLNSFLGIVNVTLRSDGRCNWVVVTREEISFFTMSQCEVCTDGLGQLLL